MRKKVFAHVLITLVIFLLFLLLTSIPILGCQGDGVSFMGGEVKSAPHEVLNNV